MPSGLTAKLVDRAMEKYGVPEWARPYVYKYVSRNKAESIRTAISMVSFGRKKGALADGCAILPNGRKFKMASILKLLGVIFHGEQNLADLEEYWVKNHMVGNPEYVANYTELSEMDRKGARAMKNLIEGLKYKVPEDNNSLSPLFDKLRSLESWEDRVFASGIVLNYCYMKTFTGMFMKVFYPVVPEFMRTFGKAFTMKDATERWDLLEARKLVASGKISRERAIELMNELLLLVKKSIDLNTEIVRELELKEEISLLEDISMVYPIQVLSKLGLEVPLPEGLTKVKK